MRLSVVYGVSIAVHLGVAGAVWSLKKPVVKERVGVTIREVKKAAPKPPPPEPPPPVKKAAAPRKLATAAPRPAPAPARAAAPAAVAAAPVADFGLMMASGGDGPALAAATPAVDRPAPRKEEARPPRPKLLGAPAADDDEGCPDAPVKPKPITVVQPTYTDEARGAQIEGKVRVEITVAADGTVANVRVIQGLGHGLDEAALEAARGSTFEAGTKCGKPIATTFTIGMRFSL